MRLISHSFLPWKWFEQHVECLIYVSWFPATGYSLPTMLTRNHRRSLPLHSHSPLGRTRGHPHAREQPLLQSYFSFLCVFGQLEHQKPKWRLIKRMKIVSLLDNISFIRVATIPLHQRVRHWSKLTEQTRIFRGVGMCDVEVSAASPSWFRTSMNRSLFCSATPTSCATYMMCDNVFYTWDAL